MRKCVLHIHVHVPKLKYRSAEWYSSMAWTYFASYGLFKPRFVKYFAMFFGYITWVYGLPVWKLMTDFLMTLLDTSRNDIQVTPKIIYGNNVSY